MRLVVGYLNFRPSQENFRKDLGSEQPHRISTLALEPVSAAECETSQSAAAGHACIMLFMKQLTGWGLQSYCSTSRNVAWDYDCSDHTIQDSACQANFSLGIQTTYGYQSIHGANNRCPPG